MKSIIISYFFHNLCDVNNIISIMKKKEGEILLMKNHGMLFHHKL